MFKLNEFVLRCITGMIGNEPDYKVMEYALGWYNKSVLTEDDLANIDNLLAYQYTDVKTEAEIADTVEL